MKLLNAPYGWPSGRGFVLRATAPIDRNTVEVLLLQFGCHPPVVPKILDCLTCSGRYECRLNSIAADTIERSRRRFAEASLEFELEPKEAAEANEQNHRRLCREQLVSAAPFTRPRIGIPLIEHGVNGVT